MGHPALVASPDLPNRGVLTQTLKPLSPEASAARRIKLSHLVTVRALAMGAECQTVLAVYFLR